MKYRTVLLFGAPGSGKGTQGRILGQVPNFYYFACGDVFRNLRPEDPLGRKFVEYSGRGALVPDDLTLDLWRRHIQANILTGKFHPDHDTLLLDGIPRNPSQVDLMWDAMDVRAVLHLACKDTEKMIARIQRRALLENRLDDANVDVIRQRFATYEAETRPVLDKFPRALIHEFDSTQSPVAVLSDILQVLKRLD